MRALRPLLTPLTFAALVTLPALPSAAQETLSVQKLLERGAFEQAMQRAETERDPESTFLAAQAALRINDNGRVAEHYGRLRDAGDESWKAIGESGARLAEGDLSGAMDAANRAVAANGDNPFAHYQAGVVANRQSNYQRAMEAFERAAELKPDFAYAHYYAGAASQRMKQIAKMSEHFEIFLKLAPEAPERTAVAALLRTLRPRR